MFPVFMEIMPRLRLFTLILAKILALTNKVLKYFFSTFSFFHPSSSPPIILMYCSLELKAYTSAGLRSLEYKFSALFAKQIGQVLFSPRPCEHHLQTLFFFPPENTYLQMNISCFFSLLSLSPL